MGPTGRCEPLPERPNSYYRDPPNCGTNTLPVRTAAGTRLRDFMEIPPITVSGETTIDEATTLMWEKNVGSVIVVDQEGTMIGIVTERDVVFSVSKSMIGKGIPVSSIMSKTFIRASPNEGIATAVEKMLQSGVRHLPVVDKQGKALGMVSMRDAMEVSGPLLKLVLRSTKQRPVA